MQATRENEIFDSGLSETNTLLISVDKTISFCDMRSWSYLIRKYLRLALTSIDQHKLSLVVNSVRSSCSVTVVNAHLLKYGCLLKDNNNLSSYWLYNYFLLRLFIVKAIPGNYLSFYF